MAHDPDEDRIRRKAHELWVAEGHPHGRHEDHWEQAREIIAIEDSQKSTLLPRDTGAEEPVESGEIAESYSDLPNLTDQGEHSLTDIDREPAVTAPVNTATTKVAGAAVGQAKETQAPLVDKTAASEAKLPGKAEVAAKAAPKPAAKSPPAAPKSTKPAGAKGR